MNNQPIGVFDSGIGGLTVANAILERMPNEQLVYFGDTAHLPYGDKSADAIRYYCLKIGKFLLEKNCKLIVVACNSASSVGYHVLLEFFRDQALFVNVVDPLVEAVANHNYQKVGIIATKATIRSGVYQNLLALRAPETEVISQATPLLAPMIEEGFVHNQISAAVLDTYLGYPKFGGIEALLLACTHYPLIKGDILDFFDHQIDVIDSGNLVAQRVEELLKKHQALNDGNTRGIHQFFISDYTASFEETASLFYPSAIALEQCNIW